MAGKKRSNAVVPPYVPTEKEAGILEGLKTSRKQAIRQRMKVHHHDDGKGGRSIKVDIDHADRNTGWRMLEASFGTSDFDFSCLMLAGVASFTTTGKRDASTDEKMLNSALAAVQAVRPRDELESMLAAQMAAMHIATIRMAEDMAQAANVERRESAERSMNRCARTFVTQIEALKRYRSKGDQKVTVEHVHVHPGAQAVVGQVNQGKIENGENGVHLSERAAVLGAIEADKVPVSSARGDGLDGLPISRRPRRPALRSVK